MAQHRSFLVLPDPALAGESAVHSVSSQGGRIPGRGTPDSTNEGNLSAFVTGKAESDAASFQLRIQTSGGVTDGATWAWKRVDESDDNLRGANDRRFLHGLTDPFHPGSVSNPIPIARTEILYSPRLNREYLYKDGTGDRLEVLYRTVGETENPWTSDTARFAGGIDFNGSETMQFAGCVLPDGAFRMIVFRANDLDVYHSDDGLQWERVADNIVSRFADRLVQSFEGLWLVESGGYLMISGAEGSVDGSAGFGTYLTTLVSSDRGSTWTEIDFGTFPLGLAISRYGPSGVDRYAISVCGVGDAAGTFFYTNRSAFSPNSFIVARRSGFGSWGNVESYSLGGTNQFDRVILGRTATHIIALFIDRTSPASRVTSPGEYGIATLDRRLSLADQEWDIRPDFTFFDGSPRYRLGLGKAVWIGNSLAIFGKKYEWSSGARVNGTIYQRLGEGWSKAPISDLVWDGYSIGSGRPIGHQPKGALFDGIEWHAHYGLPFDSPFSSWILRTTGGSVGRRGDRMQLAGFPSGNVYYEREDVVGTAPTVSWMTSTLSTQIGGSLVTWEVEVRSAPSPDLAVEILSRDPANPGDQVEVRVTMTQTEAVIRDGNTGGILATLTPPSGTYGTTPFADRWEYRLCFMPRPPHRARQCLLMCRKFGTTDWLATDIVNFSTVPRSISGTTVTQRARFGIITVPPSGVVDSVWYSFRIHEGDDLRQAVQVRGGNPALYDEGKAHATRGRECSPFPVSIVEGVEASWGGGGGFDGDTYESRVEYQYAASNALLGPRFEYRSEDGAASGPSLVFTAGSESHARFRHDALAVFGLNSGEVAVDYDDDPAFPSPTSAGTLSLERFSNIRIGAVDGESVTIEGSSLPEDGSVATNNARRFFVHVKAIPAGCTSIAVGDVFEISNQRESVLDLDSGLFLASTVGSTLSIYSDRGVLAYSAPVTGRFLRLSLTTVNPPDTRYAIGAIVAGSTMPFDVPLEWEHSDEDAPTATQYRSRSGISWAYIEGPPRRTVTGTVVGDAGTFRARLRNLLRSTARYVERPVVLCMDDADLTNAETTVLARIPNGISFEQTGWRYLEDEDRWIQVGDASLDFEQDV